MKQSILFYLMLFGALIHSPYVLGQQSGSTFDTEDPSINYIPTPQTWAFIRYGSTPVDYYTGTAQVNVPIYEYADKDFSLNISAGYASNGFQPQRQTGILGLNWFLNCGGSVTREIRGVADDEQVYNTQTNEFSTGCILLPNNKYDDTRVFNLLDVSRMTESSAWSANGREVDADIFRFSFMGHSGTFHINGQRELCVYNTGGNHGTYKIELQQHDTGGEILGFTIRTGDGYTYVFGGNSMDEKYRERSIRGNFDSPGYYRYVQSDRHPVVTWFLREVTAPNGRKMTFDYDSGDPAYGYLSSNQNNESRNNPNYVVSFAMGRNMIPDPFGGVDENGMPRVTNHYRHASVVRTSYLTRITVGEGGFVNGKVIIDFEYSLKNSRDATYTSDYVTDLAKADANIAQRLKKLDAIRVASALGDVEQCKFNYRLNTIGNNRLMLENINVRGVGSYKMSYYDAPLGYADISTSAVDFWGYYNGRDGNLYSEIAPTKIDSLRLTQNEYVAKDYRNPNWRYGIAGCLKRIVYPTKGFTEFEYEANRAKNMVQRNETALLDEEEIRDDNVTENPIQDPWGTHYLAALNAYSKTFRNSDETGGVRVRKITDSDGVGESQVRTFEYGKGTVMSFPRFWSYSQYGYNMINPYINIPANTFDQSHIGYDTVTEKYSDGSFVEYRFNNYRSHPDEYSDQNRKKYTTLPYVMKDSVFLNNISRKPNSRHYQRGKLNRITSYDKERKMVRCERMEYADHDGGQNFSAYVVASSHYLYSVKKYTGDYRLVRKTVTDYIGRDSISTTTSYMYNSMGQISSTSRWSSQDDREHSTKIDYLHEYVHGFNPDAVPLTCIGYVQDSYTPLRANASEQVISATKYTYSRFNNTGIVQPSVVSQLDTDGPTTIVKWPVTPVTFQFKDKVYYKAYDTKGNPTEVWDASGVKTSYLWGYNGLYPVAKVIGATYAQIKSALGLTGNAPLTEALTPTQEAALRAITGTYVDTYVYKAHVGMTRHTDAAGKIYTYEYDTYGRLERTNDPLGVVQEYEYHL
ncbi:RHS repeat domain-containing protein [uncultured Alistipes sp.]|jgi:hypothetical protein|uniref:RHS repeat domain-containing protein n=1 Tax=uncultured Alistipes sp. TaxID=538949 RepID=UPI0025D86DF0|nr:RHS repeat domain-containing protein [uncultured Alistipes sp.]